MKHINKNTPAKKRKPSNPRRRKSPPAEEIVAPPGPDAPHWIPTDDRWRNLPERIREAVPRILAPAYRRFVLDAPGELERSVGLTLVHLTWLELCDQIQLAVAAADPTSLDAILKSPEDMLDRHLRLTTVKCQTAELLMKLQIVQNALQRSAGNPALSSNLAGAPALSGSVSSQPALPAFPFPLPPVGSEDQDRFPASFPQPAESPLEAEIGNPNSR